MFLRATVILIVATACCCGGRAAAQTDLSVERRLLEGLIIDGKYKQVVAETRQLEKTLLDGRAPKGGHQTAVVLDLLGFRMFAEREMGLLADAEKSLGDAQRLFKSKDFQRALPGFPAVPVALMYFSLIDEEALLLLERMRSENHGLALAQAAAAAAGGAKTTASPDPEAWEERFERLDKLVKHAADTRAAARLPGLDEAAEARSPYARAMLGQFRPHLLIGKRYLEAAKLPFTLPAERLGESAAAAGATDEPGKPAAGTAAATESPAARASAAARQLRRAVEYLEEAVADADTACTAALGAFGGDDEERAGSAAYLSATKEAARIRCTAREALAEALLKSGDPDRARQTLAPAIVDLRKAEKPRHPALAEPLILDAEISLAEMQRSIAAKNTAAADRQSRAAVEALREAKTLLAVPESGFDPAAPIHQLLDRTLAQAEAKQKQTQESVAQREAADAAARRALKAINATESRKPAPPRPPAPPAEAQTAE